MNFANFCDYNDVSLVTWDTSQSTPLAPKGKLSSEAKKKKQK